MVFVKNFELQTFCSEARNNTTITADRNWAVNFNEVLMLILMKLILINFNEVNFKQYRVNFNEVFPKIRATLND